MSRNHTPMEAQVSKPKPLVFNVQTWTIWNPIGCNGGSEAYGENDGGLRYYCDSKIIAWHPSVCSLILGTHWNIFRKPCISAQALWSPLGFSNINTFGWEICLKLVHNNELFYVWPTLLCNFFVDTETIQGSWADSVAISHKHLNIASASQRYICASCCISRPCI